MKFINLTQGSQEWLSLRRKKIGASDSPVIMEVSPYLTPYKLWLEKLSGIGQKENAAMARGKELESQALHSFEKKTGLCMFPKVVECKEHDYLIASLDGMDLDQSNIVEIKCNGAKSHSMVIAGNVPLHHYAQVQHQLMCTKLPMSYYYSYDGADGVILEIYRDDEYIAKLIEIEKQFYKCMVEFEPPELNNRDFISMEDADFIEKAKKLLDLRHNRRLLEQQEDDLTKELIAKAGGLNVIGGGIQITKVLRKGLVDYGAIPEIKGIDLEKWRKESKESWRITEKKPS